MRNQVFNTISPLCKELLKGLLTYDPKKRLSAQSALMHNWFLMDEFDLHKNYLTEKNEADKRQMGIITGNEFASQKDIIQNLDIYNLETNEIKNYLANMKTFNIT